MAETCNVVHGIQICPMGYCDKVRHHAGSHVCNACGHTFSRKDEDLMKDKSQWCLSDCPKCVGKCCREKGHTEKHCCALDHRW